VTRADRLAREVGREGAVLFTRYGSIVRKAVVPFVAVGDLQLKIPRVLLAGRLRLARGLQAAW
jgi:hypothetical protein